MATTSDADDTGPGELSDRSPSPEELQRLFAANLDHVRAFVRLHVDATTRSHESVSDIVQSACREVLASESFEFRGEDAFRSYLCQAALHKIQARRRHWRAKKRDVAKERPAPTDMGLGGVYRTTMFDPLRRTIRAEEIEQLEAAFDELPADYREALALYRIAGLSVAELAARIGRSEAATKMLLSRAMARLSSVLQKGS